MTDDLVDRIYECAVAPELWPDVLDALSQIVTARGGLMFSSRQTLSWTASEAVREVFDTYVRDGWFKRCSRRPCLMSRSDPSFFREQDFWSLDQLEQEPIYRDFFRPRGLGWSAGTALRIPTGDDIVFSVERDFETGPIGVEEVDRLNGLRPHLARAALVTARLGRQRATGALEALTALGLPAVLLGPDGTALEANAEAETLTDLIGFGAGRRVRLLDRSAEARRVAALEAVETGERDVPASFLIRDAEGRPTRVGHLVPVRRTAQDIFGGAAALMVLTPAAGDRAPSQALLRTLFDLTPAEARVAQGVAVGRSPEQIAHEAGVAITTVRTQLRRVLEKTGCTRQAEAAALLAGTAALPA